MNDEINSNVMVDDFYGEPLDVVKYINTDSADEFMCLLIDEAIDYYVSNQYSPMIEQEKSEKGDRFIVDYYFLIDCLSKFIESKVMKVVNDEKFVKNVRLKFKNDYIGAGEHFNDNASFVLSLLSFLKVVVFYRKNRYFLMQTAYSYFEQKSMSDEVFLVTGVILNSKFIEKNIEAMKKIGTKTKYKMLGFGSGYVSRLVLKLQREEKKVIQF